MPELEECSGIRYLRESAYDRKTIKQITRPAIAQVKTFKEYPDAPKIELHRTWELSQSKITSLLQNRRSLRKYGKEPIKLEELAFMLWASQGITAKSAHYSFRTSPSGGALYPIETYLSANRVEGLEPGLYHFDPQNFCLDQLSKGDSTKDVAACCLDQNFMVNAAVCFMWTGVLRRCLSKYGNRGMRYVILDAGHICQNLLTAAEATGNGACPVAAFYDNEMNTLLGLDAAEETAIYAAAVGKKQEIKGEGLKLLKTGAAV